MLYFGSKKIMLDWNNRIKVISLNLLNIESFIYMCKRILYKYK